MVRRGGEDHITGQDDFAFCQVSRSQLRKDVTSHFRCARVPTRNEYVFSKSGKLLSLYCQQILFPAVHYFMPTTKSDRLLPYVYLLILTSSF